MVRCIALNNTRSPTAPAEAPVLPSRGAINQGKLGYENHPTYDYLARS